MKTQEEHTESTQEGVTVHSHSRVRLFLVGCVMGIADLTPGVSGGTIALVANVYNDFIVSLRAVTNTAVGHIVRGRIREAWRAIPFNFLVPLVGGIGVAVFSFAQIFSWLLRAYAVFVWAFFFGLIVASIIVVFGRIRTRSFPIVISSIVGASIAYVITGLIPLVTPATPFLFFASGAIAITAMILPGISGSFILVILGKYQQFISAVAERDIAILAIFILGAVTGLALFSRVISFFLRTYHDITIALLCGFMIGSLRTVWPWKEEASGGIWHNTVPEALDAHTIAAIAFAITGAFALLALDRVSRTRKDHSA